MDSKRWNRKRILPAGMLLLLLWSLYGCQRTGEAPDTIPTGDPAEPELSEPSDGLIHLTVEEPADTEGGRSFPKEYQYNEDSISIDITLDLPETVCFREGTAELDVEGYDWVSIGRQVMPEDGTNELRTYENSGIIQSKDSDITYFDYSDSGTISYSVDQGQDCLGYCVWEEKRNPDYNLDQFETKREFSFATDEEALSDIMEQLQVFGIDFGPNYKVYTYYLDHETLQKNEFHLGIDGLDHPEEYKTDWSEADDYYLFHILSTYCGLEVMPRNQFDDIYPVDPFYYSTSATYGADGIAYIHSMPPYKLRVTGEPVELLDMDTIMDTLLECLRLRTKNGSEFHVLEGMLICEFQEDPIPSSTMKAKELSPVWAFSVEEISADGSRRLFEIQIDGVSGHITKE